MRYVILGAGAVGGTIGGRLADAGHDVVLLARGAHADALREHGLRVGTPERTIVVRAPVVDRPQALRLTRDDTLVVTTKTQDTASLLHAVAGLHGAGTLPVICAQNGVENERIALRLFASVYGMVVMLPAEHLEPGRVEAHGTPCSGLLDVGRVPGGVDDVAHTVAADLSAAGFSSRAVDDVMAWKRAKLLRNLGNAIEALAGHDLDDDGRVGAARIERAARAEATACLRAAGLDWVDDAEWDSRRGHLVDYAPVDGVERSGGSTWQSLRRGAGTVEVDYLNGEIVLLGRIHDVPTPVNTLLQREVSALARAGGAPGALSMRHLLDRLEGELDD
jgi:2-dehydropantoate 2-reductase